MENLEQPQENLGSNNFGKFKDADSLLKAYNSLESEFTKKSQRLAVLENEKEKQEKEVAFQEQIEQRIDNFIEKFESIKPFRSALKETLINVEGASLEEEAVRLLSNHYKSADFYANDSEFLNNYIFSNKEIKDKIVKDYLSNITQNSPIKVEGKGSISLTPPKQPTTIKEAGYLAKSIIKQK